MPYPQTWQINLVAKHKSPKNSQNSPAIEKKSPISTNFPDNGIFSCEMKNEAENNISIPFSTHYINQLQQV